MIGLCLIAAAGLAQTPEAFDAFFTEFAAKRDGVKTLEASFTQKNVLPDETLETSGTIVYVRPKRIVFRYAPPDPTYLIDSVRVYEYSPDIQQVQIYDLGEDPQTEVFFLGFEDDTRRLREGYDVELFDPEDGPAGAKGIVLRPKTQDGAEPLFERAMLFLRAEDYLPYRIHIVNDAESQVTIEVSNLAVNKPLDPAQAQIALTPNTVVIQDEAVLRTVGPEGELVPEQPKLPATLEPETPSVEADRP
jgi:outer membrane lipoprotein-sorting protein